MANLLKWRSRRGNANYSAELKGTTLFLSRDEGAVQSYGGKTLLGRHLLEKEKWQKEITKNYGPKICREIIRMVEDLYNK